MAPPHHVVRELAHEAGFELVRFGPAATGIDGDRFAAWLDAGRAGEMAWLHRNRERIVDPGRYAPGSRSTIALGARYGSAPASLPGGGRIARYARGRDYHRVLGKGVDRLRERLAAEGLPFAAMRGGTDALPVLERALAARAGIGFLAKSASVISPVAGPWLLLAELLTPQELPHDGPSPGSCGTCTRCLDACPTGAITAPFEVDARRCLSYTTIELRGPIPHELRAPQGEWVFGCDVCLEVCPFTRFAGRGQGGPLDAALTAPHRVTETFTLVGLLELTEVEWQEQWVGTAMRRATRRGLRRNAAVVLGNLGDDAAVPALTRALVDPDPHVRGHAAWALGRLAPRSPALRQALDRETDPFARSELVAALGG